MTMKNEKTSKLGLHHIAFVLVSLMLAVTAECASAPGKLVETDPESGAQIYLLGADNRPADNIYGEQPYGDPTGRWIAIRYFADANQPGGISIIDLTDGSRRDVFAGNPRFPAFHPWGEYLYYQQTVDANLMLRRCRYDTLKIEDVAVLPAKMGNFSYGTVSQDYRYYVVSVIEKEGELSKVHLLNLQTGQWRLLLDKPGFHAKHEQFSRDGRNRVLIQLNGKIDGIKGVILSELTLDGREYSFPADRPYTKKPTGHECWIGTTDRIFFSTGGSVEDTKNIWSAKVGEPNAIHIISGKHLAHVSISKCGRFWIADTDEEGLPIYVGRFGSNTCKRLVFSRTSFDKYLGHAHPYMTADNQWLIFTSVRDGHPQVYGAKLKEGWLDSL